MQILAMSYYKFGRHLPRTKMIYTVASLMLLSSIILALDVFLTFMFHNKTLFDMSSDVSWPHRRRLPSMP